jgi:hypothetical protein
LTALIATIAPGAAWLSSDSWWEHEDWIADRGAKFALLHGKTTIAAGTGAVDALRSFYAWSEASGWDDAQGGASAFLPLCRTPLTVFLVRAGAGWVWTFEDEFVPHALEFHGHSCRPAFSDLPNVSELREASVTAGEGENVEAFHYDYLRLAAAWPDKPRYIGGCGWCARVVEGRSAEVVELGALC